MDPEHGWDQERCPFRLEQCGDLGVLRRELADLGFTQSALEEIGDADLRQRFFDPRKLHRQTGEETPFNTLTRLFILAQPVTLQAAQKTLPASEIQHLIAMGLLEDLGGRVRSRAMLMYVDDLLLASDFEGVVTRRPLAADHVMVCSAPSLVVDCLTVRKKAECVLDLGTGSGIQALWAAPHAGKVIATDTNPRALNFAAFNARLNGISNIEFRRGSLYEPVRECEFDLIIANPPYVISPESRYEFRDGGMTGDRFAEMVIHGAPELLKEDAYFVVLFNWYQRAGEHWPDRPRRWIESSGCDAWLLSLTTQDSLSYASNMLNNTEWSDSERREQILDQWMEYYKRLEITHVRGGALISRRCSTRPNWFRADEMPQYRRNGSCSEQIQDIFAAESFLAGLEYEKDLQEHSFIMAPDHCLEYELQAENGSWRVRKARLRHTGGFECLTAVDQHITSLIVGFDGKTVLGEQVAAFGARLNKKSEEVAPLCVRAVRDLMRWGFIRRSE